MPWLPELAAAILAAVLAIILHEVAHGYAALALGDDTARRAGRLTLNPVRHVDPVGTILVPGVLLLGQLLAGGSVGFMFGWAKPVPVNPWALRHPRRGMVLVAAAGPAVNFVLAFLAAFALQWLATPSDFVSGDSIAWGYRFLVNFILFNLVLGLFNLLPIPPLDGGRILAGLLPASLAAPYMRLERWGILVVLVGVFLLPRLVEGFDPIGWALSNVIEGAFNMVLILSSDLLLLLSGHGGGT